MTLTRWSPVAGLAALEVNQLNQMFEAAFNGVGPGTWTPAVDILETAEQALVVKVELPEIKREEINITVENDVLTIQGERKFEQAKESERYHRVERAFGAFRRSFTLPSQVDAGRVQANFRDGVLTVTLPRREETRPRQIQVNG